MLLATCFFTILNLALRHVDHLSTMQLILFRSLGSAVCGLIYLKGTKTPLLGTNKKLLLLRGVVGVIAMAFFYKSIQMMPLANALSIRYTAPFFAAFLAIIYLKEKILNIQWLFFALAFLGVLFLKGFDNRITLLGLTLALIASFLTGIIYVVIRKIGNSEHPVVVVNYFMCISLLVGAIGSIFSWTPPTAEEWPILLGMGIIGFIAQVFMTRSLQTAETNIVTPIKYMEVVLTLLASWIVFDEFQTPWTLAAMALIILSLLANIYVKSRKTA